MRRCPECEVDIEGSWHHCPLCRTPVGGKPAPSPFPTIPLSYSRRRLLRVLLLTSLVVIVASFAGQLLLERGPRSFGLLRVIWLGVSAMWLLAVTAVLKRRNIAKGTVYLVVLVSLVCVYWDYLNGWDAWSLTFAVPILCAASIVALLITVRVMRTDVGDHIVYSALTVLLGLTPLVFLGFGWVSTPLPSAICGALSLCTLVLMQMVQGPDMFHELHKRLRP